jgi:predicted transcriptional regulator
MNDIYEHVLKVVEHHDKGITSKDINEFLDNQNIKRGRNTVNATLNNLHSEGCVFATRLGRNYLYFHSSYKNNFKDSLRIDKPIPQTKWERAARLWREVAESDTLNPDLYRQALKEFKAAENG